MTETEREFEAHRGLLRALAYRMTGSRAEADDLLQEAWLRWAGAERAAVRSPRAFLVTTVTRLCVDHVRSARARRETYVGPWLPEPVRTDDGSAWITAERDRATLSLAFLAVLERLSPLERAAFVLHEAFEYEHAEVAAILERDERAVRQLVHRARAHLADAKVRFAPDRATHARMLQGFLLATATGDVAGLARMLAADATSASDGNGRRGAARRVISGAAAVARAWCGITRLQRERVRRAEFVEVNGWPAVLMEDTAGEFVLLAIETDGAAITRVMSVVAPDKLRALVR
jgi:RNA polymerase sigma-70 factor (ECF subfamily)